MGKYISGNYSEASTVSNDYLEEVKSSIDTVKSDLDAYITGAKEKLDGQASSLIMSRLNMYKSAFEKLSKTCSSVDTSITGANNSVINAMEGYTEITDEMLDELKRSLEKAEKVKWQLQVLISGLTWEEYYADTTEKKEEIADRRTTYESDYSRCVSSINTISAEIKIVEKVLENTSSKDSSMSKSVETIMNSLQSFCDDIEAVSIKGV